MNHKSYEVRVVHMASMARSGETMMLRILSAHPMIRVAGQLVDSSEGEKRIRFFRTWKSHTIPCNHEAIIDLDAPEDGIVLVKQGTWEHPWTFEGFILARNPLSVYYSLTNYDTVWVRELEKALHGFGKTGLAIRLRGNFERFYRWTNDIDKSLVDKYPSLEFIEIFCSFYNRRMTHLSKLGLPILHYESIVGAPEKELCSLCDRLEIPFDAEMLHSHKKFPESTTGHGKNSLSQPIDNKSNEKATRVPKKVREKILALTQSTWHHLGYRERDGILALQGEK